MKPPEHDQPFYIGYLPKAAPQTSRFIRTRVGTMAAAGALVAAGAALILPHIGAGVFEFGTLQEVSGTLRCGVAPILETERGDLPLVGVSKHGAPIELCGADGTEVLVLGTRIARDQTELFEVSAFTSLHRSGDGEAAPALLGSFSLTGEIVDSKCYFGVMNPGEGRLHRACAVQCLRGGIPAVFIARDQTGATVPLLLTTANGASGHEAFLPLVGEIIRLEGDVLRQGRWLVLRAAPESLRRAVR